MTISKDDLLKNGYKFHIENSVLKPGLYLVGEFEFGDADGNTKEELGIDSFEELEALNKFFTYLDSLGWNAEISYRTGTKWLNNFYEIVGPEWEEKYLEEGLLDWWARDPVGDCPARLGKTWLIYSDGQREWSVEK